MKNTKQLKRFDWVDEIYTPDSWDDLSEKIKSIPDDKTLLPIANPTALSPPPENKNGVIICPLSDLPKMFDINRTALYLTVSANSTISDINEHLNNNEMKLANLPVCGETTAGGWLSTYSSGIDRLDYGGAERDLLGIEVILPDGEQVFFGRKTQKGVAGYELSRLFLNKWGYAGIIKSVTFRLRPRGKLKRIMTVNPENMGDVLDISTEMLYQFRTLTSAILLLNSGNDGSSQSRGIFKFEGSENEVNRETEQIEDSLIELGFEPTEGIREEQIRDNICKLYDETTYIVGGYIEGDDEFQKRAILDLSGKSSIVYNLIGNEVLAFSDEEAPTEDIKLHRKAKKEGGVFISQIELPDESRQLMEIFE